MRCKNLLRTIALPLLLFVFQTAYSQGKVVTGTVTDQRDGSPLAGVSVALKGSTTGTTTSTDGTFRILVPQGINTLVISSVGFATQEINISSTTNISVSMVISGESLGEVVVIGYGTRQKKDLTGSVSSITEEDFNQGPIVSPEQLIMGKAPGVQITTNGGAPGSGSRIRIRGAASLNANNSPLIVVDNVPLDFSGVAGTANPLNLINPDDIESISILKDASATAIYGNRASNGVIIITTKKGKSGALKVGFNSIQSVAARYNDVDVLNADQYRELVMAEATPTQAALLGNANTDWQDVIYRSAFATDNTISFTGGIKGLPTRFSLGYLNQDGILKTDNLQRTSLTASLNPTFFNNHLRVDLNLKGSISRSNFADQGAIGSAVFFDPTQPIYSGSSMFGGYFEWLDPATDLPNTLAPRNPLGLLYQRDNVGIVRRSIGNVQFDYKMHFLPELRANLNLGYDVSETEGEDYTPPTSASGHLDMGRLSRYGQNKTAKLMEGYLNYSNNFPEAKSNVDITAGYSYQDWLREEPSFPLLRADGSVIVPANVNPFKTQNTLISFFGRANYSYDDKYLLTASIRRDGSSRFGEDNRWGIFPAGAIAWRISNEDFLRNSTVVSDLKLRFGYGVTGQQEIGGDYLYLARYTYSDSTAMYLFGDQYYFTLRPEGYDANLRWEETETLNAGLDFGFLGNRIYGSIDLYKRETKDLLAVVSVPAGSNLTNRILTNVGNMESRGIEFNLGGTAIKTRDFNWDANFNLTYNEVEITKLNLVQNPSDPGNEVGGISGGVGNTVQINTVGYMPGMFYVYKQVYDQDGNPVEGLYVDLNKDGVVDQQDKYRYKNGEPQVYMGFSSMFNYKKWSLNFTTRASIGNYMYNNFNANNGSYLNFGYQNYLGNISSNVLETNFTGNDQNRYWSDYFIENASFFRMDNLNLGYDFGRIMQNKINLRVTATVQNVFVITKYTGLDPEIAGGIDNNFYPRPRIYSLGLNVNM